MGRVHHVVVTDAPPTFPSAPPERIELDEGVALVRCRAERTPAAVESINSTIDHLWPWMAWASEPATEAGMATFFAAAEELWDQRHDFGYSIIDAGEAVLGGCGLHGRLGTDGFEIGYWVHVDHIGRGRATAAARALTHAAFTIEGIERVRITCEEANVRSARVPVKLGYSFQGITVPEGGPCEGRSTQVWQMPRARWMTGRSPTAP